MGILPSLIRWSEDDVKFFLCKVYMETKLGISSCPGSQRNYLDMHESFFPFLPSSLSRGRAMLLLLVPSPNSWDLLAACSPYLSGRAASCAFFICSTYFKTVVRACTQSFHWPFLITTMVCSSCLSNQGKTPDSQVKRHWLPLWIRKIKVCVFVQTYMLLDHIDRFSLTPIGGQSYD